ncbi:MAG: hypothetical protein J7K14_08980 [Sulfurimonas sp.]|nr:hypothetical protein [Sulfurimonas sp.]
MIKVTIEYKFRGNVDLPENRYAKDVFFRVKQAYANHEKMSVSLVFTQNKLHALKTYQKGSAIDELENLELYIELGEILNFKTDDAKKLKNSILFINDNAHSNFNIKKRVKLANKQHKTKTDKSYMFWDIENFSSISSIFNDLIEPFDIEDKNIFLAANPDSLYLKRSEWEANLYDYGKTLNSFNFTKCDHGKDVADDILLQQYIDLKLKNSDIYMMTFDRELKERFVEATHESNNLFIMGR